VSTGDAWESIGEFLVDQCGRSVIIAGATLV
jgi:hypothetical protein